MESATMKLNNPFSCGHSPHYRVDIPRNAKLQSGSGAIIQIWFVRETYVDENIAVF